MSSKWSWGERLFVAGGLLVAVTFFVSMHFWRPTGAVDTFNITLLPRGKDALMPRDRTEASKGFQFWVDVTAQFRLQYPEYNISVDTFRATVLNGNTRSGAAEMQLKYGNYTSGSVDTKDLLSTVKIPVNIAINKGDFGFDECINSKASLSLRFDYWMLLSYEPVENRTLFKTRSFSEFIPLKCQFT